ncbi:MAG: hypothetical protein J0I97_05935, partial [Microbacterium sp.]|nr:hypothetical protein [Microbacterium sp.]
VCTAYEEDANPGTKHITRDDERALRERVRGVTCRDPGNGGWDHKGEDKDAAHEREPCLVDNDEDEGKVEGIRCHARRETREAEHAKWLLLEEWYAVLQVTCRLHRPGLSRALRSDGVRA